MGISISELRDDIAVVDSPAYVAFYSGMAETAREMRERDIELAKAGSPSAADALRDHLRKMMNDL